MLSCWLSAQLIVGPSYDDPPVSTGKGPSIPTQMNNNCALTSEKSTSDDVDVGQLTSGVGDQPEQDSVATDAAGGTADVGEAAAPSQDMQTDISVQRLVAEAGESAGRLVNLMVSKIPSFDDACRYEGRRVRLLKRAQIFVADVYGAFQGKGLGRFQDIGHLTMFAGEYCAMCTRARQPGIETR